MSVVPLREIDGIRQMYEVMINRLLRISSKVWNVLSIVVKFVEFYFRQQINKHHHYFIVESSTHFVDVECCTVSWQQMENANSIINLIFIIYLYMYLWFYFLLLKCLIIL